jgi:hypothetical protein
VVFWPTVRATQEASHVKGDRGRSLGPPLTAFHWAKTRFYRAACRSSDDAGPAGRTACAGAFVANGRAAPSASLWTRWGTTFTVNSGAAVQTGVGSLSPSEQRPTGG